MDIISKSSAKEKGLKVYFTGRPCKRGGIAERRVSSNQCLCPACMDYRRKNNAVYMAQHREINPEYMRRYREENKISISEYNRRYNSDNSDSISQKKRNDYQDNKEYYADKNRRWQRINPDKKRAKDSKRRAAKLKAVPLWYGEFDEFVISEAHDLAVTREMETKIRWDVDHMIPLQSGNACGLHCAENIQVIPKSINSAKRNRMIFTDRFEWLSSM